MRWGLVVSRARTKCSSFHQLLMSISSDLQVSKPSEYFNREPVIMHRQMHLIHGKMKWISMFVFGWRLFQQTVLLDQNSSKLWIQACIPRGICCLFCSATKGCFNQRTACKSMLALFTAPTLLSFSVPCVVFSDNTTRSMSMPSRVLMTRTSQYCLNKYDI